MALGVWNVLDWFPGGDAILRADSVSLSASTTAGGEDRISALPDHLLKDILSRLPADDAARTAVLASRWRHLWRSTPLVFHDTHLLRSSQPEIAAAAAAALAAHPGPFATVSIGWCDFRCQSRELADCPRLLAAKGVRDLALVNMAADRDHLPDAPAEVLSCASLRRLFLGLFRFPDTGASPPHREEEFPHLRELGLFAVHMPDCGNLNRLLARSPVLDTLVVVLSQIFHHIHLTSQSLKCAILWSYYAQEIAAVDCPLLERLILWNASFDEDSLIMAVKIAAAPKLRVLGYLEPRVHRLKIGDSLIKTDTKPSPSTVVPSVKVLALKVNFGVLKEVKMLASFLRCFPNIEMLHIESLPAVEPTGRHNAKFWRELRPIDSLKSHVTEMVVHEFRGDRSEMEFLKFIDRSAEEMQCLLLRTTAEKFASEDEMDELMTKVDDFTHRGWVCDHSKVLLGGPMEDIWSFRRASDLSVNNPFQCWS